MSGCPHRLPALDISVWLEREAAKCANENPINHERAERLREAARLIRTQRADLVRLRMGKVGKV